MSCQRSYEQLSAELQIHNHPLSKSKPGALDLSRATSALKALRSTKGGSWVSSNLAIFYDLDALCSSLESLKNGFAAEDTTATNNFLHCYAIKSCPLSFLLSMVVEDPMFGLEAASLGEVSQALRIGNVKNTHHTLSLLSTLFQYYQINSMIKLLKSRMSCK